MRFDTQRAASMLVPAASALGDHVVAQHDETQRAPGVRHRGGRARTGVARGQRRRRTGVLDRRAGRRDGRRVVAQRGEDAPRLRRRVPGDGHAQAARAVATERDLGIAGPAVHRVERVHRVDAAAQHRVQHERAEHVPRTDPLFAGEQPGVARARRGAGGPPRGRRTRARPTRAASGTPRRARAGCAWTRWWRPWARRARTAQPSVPRGSRGWPRTRWRPVPRPRPTPTARRARSRAWRAHRSSSRAGTARPRGRHHPPRGRRAPTRRSTSWRVHPGQVELLVVEGVGQLVGERHPVRGVEHLPPHGDPLRRRVVVGEHRRRVGILVHRGEIERSGHEPERGAGPASGPGAAPDPTS